jgi:hypothetical protein
MRPNHPTRIAANSYNLVNLSMPPLAVAAHHTMLGAQFSILFAQFRATHRQLLPPNPLIININAHCPMIIAQYACTATFFPVSTT